jgi:hypothetical protein
VPTKTQGSKHNDLMTWSTPTRERGTKRVEHVMSCKDLLEEKGEGFAH